MNLLRARDTLYFESLFYKWRKEDEKAEWWAGDSLVRGDHIEWFASRVRNPLIRLWVATVERPPEPAPPVDPVGQARIDSNGEISFSVGADFRGKGFGKELVKLATEAGMEDHGRLKANVDRSNEAGIRTLLACGYEIRDDVVFMRYPK